MPREGIKSKREKKSKMIPRKVGNYFSADLAFLSYRLGRKQRETHSPVSIFKSFWGCLSWEMKLEIEGRKIIFAKYRPMPDT